MKKAIRFAVHFPRNWAMPNWKNNDHAREMGEVLIASLEVARLENGSMSEFKFEPASAKPL